MAKEKRESKIGWVGLMLISVIVVVLTASSIFFFNLVPIDVKSLFAKDQDISKEDQDGAASNKQIEDVKHVQKTVGKDHQKTGEFVSSMHEFYNETTGYGRIQNLDWEEQVEQATRITATLDEVIPEVENQALKNDLKNIKTLAVQTIEGKKSDDVRDLHRMFHDLDIALNSYNGYDKIWNVTETLEQADGSD